MGKAPESQDDLTVLDRVFVDGGRQRFVAQQPEQAQRFILIGQRL